MLDLTIFLFQQSNVRIYVSRRNEYMSASATWRLRKSRASKFTQVSRVGSKRSKGYSCIRSFWIFPSCRPTAFLYEEPTANSTDPKYLRDPSGQRLCKDVASTLNLSLSTTSCPNLSALARRFQHRTFWAADFRIMADSDLGNPNFHHLFNLFESAIEEL